MFLPLSTVLRAPPHTPIAAATHALPGKLKPQAPVMKPQATSSYGPHRTQSWQQLHLPLKDFPGALWRKEAGSCREGSVIVVSLVSASHLSHALSGGLFLTLLISLLGFDHFSSLSLSGPVSLSLSLSHSLFVSLLLLSFFFSPRPLSPLPHSLHQ